MDQFSVRRWSRTDLLAQRRPLRVVWRHGRFVHPLTACSARSVAALVAKVHEKLAVGMPERLRAARYCATCESDRALEPMFLPPKSLHGPGGCPNWSMRSRALPEAPSWAFGASRPDASRSRTNRRRRWAFGDHVEPWTLRVIVTPDYATLLENDPEWADESRVRAAMAMDRARYDGRMVVYSMIEDGGAGIIMACPGVGALALFCRLPEGAPTSGVVRACLDAMGAPAHVCDAALTLDAYPHGDRRTLAQERPSPDRPRGFPPAVAAARGTLARAVARALRQPERWRLPGRTLPFDPPVDVWDGRLDAPSGVL